MDYCGEKTYSNQWKNLVNKLKLIIIAYMLIKAKLQNN